MATRSSSANSQFWGDGEKPEEMVKLKLVCEQDSPSTPTPRKKVNETKLVPEDSIAILKKIVEDNTFPPLSKYSLPQWKIYPLLLVSLEKSL